MQVSFFQRRLSIVIAVTMLAAAQEPVKTPTNAKIMTATRQVTIFPPRQPLTG